MLINLLSKLASKLYFKFTNNIIASSVKGSCATFKKDCPAVLPHVPRTDTNFTASAESCISNAVIHPYRVCIRYVSFYFHFSTFFGGGRGQIGHSVLCCISQICFYKLLRILSRTLVD